MTGFEKHKNQFAAYLVLFAVFFSALHSQAFSLGGPYSSWMSRSLGYRLPGDIGGPRPIDEEYRWNVPQLTYGFDTSFVEQFGTNGVGAVESAIRILNDLPPSDYITDQMLLSAIWPLNSTGSNPQAAVLNAYDLRSAILSRLLEHLGLANAFRFQWTLRSRTANATSTNYVLINRNFDPVSLVPSGSINLTQFGYGPIFEGAYPELETPFEVKVMKSPFSANSIAGNPPSSGQSYSSLTYDDVGGLRFLYSTNNVNLEGLPPGVTGVNGQSVFTNALRGGVGKVQFLPHPTNGPGGSFSAFTNRFTDRFIVGAERKEQSLQRISQQPDLLFSVSDPLTNGFRPMIGGSDSLEWKTLNTNQLKDGSGVIMGQAQITIRRIGPSVAGSSLLRQQWGFFDDSKIYWLSQSNSLGNSPTQNLAIHLRVQNPKPFDLRIPFTATNGQPVLLQQSSNLTNWSSGVRLTNYGASVDWRLPADSSNQFFRVIKPTP